jgi:hypothetical protein
VDGICAWWYKRRGSLGISGVPGALGVGGVGEGSRYPVHTGSGAPRSFEEHPGEPLVLAR